MPTYEFRCPDGHDFEKFYRTISSAESQAACPVCGKPAERILSPAGFSFKGSGFYLTDYGKNAHREKGPAEPKSSTGAAKDSSGGDAPASKSDAAPASSSDAPKAEKKAEPKAAESKPAPSPKSGGSE